MRLKTVTLESQYISYQQQFLIKKYYKSFRYKRRCTVRNKYFNMNKVIILVTNVSFSFEQNGFYY